ncbi:MAG: adenylate kinase family protein [Candidatus Saccharimonadales bacterium]
MIILMGIAGAGKGTQAKMLVDRDNYSLISTGDLLRVYATEDQHRRMLEGVLLRDDEIFEMIGKALDKVPDLEKCVIDGTPRSIAQADWLLNEANERNFAIRAVVHINISEDVVRQRLLGRGRSDDTEAGIAKRFEEYRNSTLPILSHLKEKGIPVFDVNGDQEPAAVHQSILECIE